MLLIIAGGSWGLLAGFFGTVDAEIRLLLMLLVPKLILTLSPLPTPSVIVVVPPAFTARDEFGRAASFDYENSNLSC